MDYFLAFLVIVLVAILWLFIFRKLKILDKPWADLKNTRKPVPTMQWIFAYIWFWLVVFFLFPEYLSNQVCIWLAVWVLPIIILEIVEELGYLWRLNFRINPIIRVCVHLISAILAIWISWIWVWQELVIMWNVFLIPQWIFIIFFAIWSIFCINAVNWVDWIYAQASGVSAIWFLTIFLLLKFVVLTHYTVFNNLDVLILTTDLSFILFLISVVYSFVEYKPLWLVRDVGIMFFGFALAYLSVVGGAKIWTVVVALSLVLFDAIWVGLYRIFIKKKSPAKWDYTHLHHRLIGLWWNRREVRIFVRVWSIVMMILMLLQWANRLNKIIIFGMMFFIFFWVNYYLFIVKKMPCGLEKLKKD